MSNYTPKVRRIDRGALEPVYVAEPAVQTFYFEGPQAESMAKAFAMDAVGPRFDGSDALTAFGIRGLAVPAAPADGYEVAERLIGSALAVLEGLPHGTGDFEGALEGTASGAMVGPLQHRDRHDRLRSVQWELAAIRHHFFTRSQGAGIGGSAGA